MTTHGDVMHYHVFSSKQQALAKCGLARALSGSWSVVLQLSASDARAQSFLPTSAVSGCAMELVRRVLNDKEFNMFHTTEGMLSSVRSPSVAQF